MASAALKETGFASFSDALEDFFSSVLHNVFACLSVCVCVGLCVFQ